MGAFAQCRKRDLAEPSGKMRSMVSWLFPVNFFFFIENLLSFYIGPYSVSLCSAFLWILFPLAVNGFCFHSLFWGKPSRISVSIEVLFLQWVKRSRSAVKLSQDKTLLTQPVPGLWSAASAIPQVTPRTFGPVCPKEGENCSDAHLKFHTERKHLGFPTRWVSVLV